MSNAHESLCPNRLVHHRPGGDPPPYSPHGTRKSHRAHVINRILNAGPDRGELVGASASGTSIPRVYGSGWFSFRAAHPTGSYGNQFDSDWLNAFASCTATGAYIARA